MLMTVVGVSRLYCVPGDLATVSTALLISSPGQQPHLWRPGLTSSLSVVTTRLGHCDQLETEL